MRLEDIQPGAILRTWHDTGAQASKPVYCRVLKIARRHVFVRCEWRDEGWMRPAVFDQAVEPEKVGYVVWH